MRARLYALFVLVTLLVACAGDATRPHLFSTDWLDDQGKSIGEVEQRLSRARPVSADISIVVAVTGPQADKLVGLPMSGGPPWSFKHALDARPVVAEGGVVVGSGGNEVFALEALTGKLLWTRPTGGLALLGAGDDGATTAVSLTSGSNSTILVVGRDGTIKRQIETDKQIGDPAVIAGVLFVPWQNQYVSAIDASTGDELGRVTLRDKVTRAQVIGGTLYFGEVAYVRFDDKINMASRGGANRITIPSRELPGTPRLLVPGTEKLPPVASAHDRDRLFARPTSSGSGPVAMDSGRFYASYFRLAFGFDAKRGNLAWVHTHDADLIGGEAIAGGLLVCDERGRVTVLSATDGRVVGQREFGEPIRSCVVNVDAFKASASAGPTMSLGEQITLAVQNREATLATAQRLLLRELATLPEESATKTLIDVASDPRTAPVLVADARAALATRRNGVEYMLTSLGRHYDFLKDVLMSPPVGPIADALAAMKEPRAAPLLATHLLDPADTDDDTRRAAAALSIVATKEELSRLYKFFAMYRGTAEGEEQVLAVASAAEAILRLDPKEGGKAVDAAAKSEMTVPALRPRLDALLTASSGAKTK